MCRRARRPRARPTSSPSRTTTSCCARICGRPLPARAAQARAAARRGEDRLDLRLLRLGADSRAGRGRRADRRARAPTSSALIAERLKAKSHYYDVARELARLASRTPVDDDGKRHFVVCSGGGPSIMEAANRGACDEGAETIGLNIVLAARAIAQHLRHPGAELPVPLFRAAQDALPAARARRRGVPRRVRHVRRDVRAADPDPDRQGPAAADPAVRARVLEPGGRISRRWPTKA